MSRPWQLPSPTDVDPALLESVGGHPLLARILAQRGLTDPLRARAHLDPGYYAPASPYDLPGMEDAVRLLRLAIIARRSVRIWGDFDTDGQTSTVVLYEGLCAAGARVDYALPTRHEGHGLHQRVVDEAVRDGVSVLITCDTGITEGQVVASGVAAGLTIIVTDHHDLPEQLPPAQAVVDSKMLPVEHPLRELSGVGVAYEVARTLLEGGPHADVLPGLLDLVAVGLVADIATQVGDVRYLIQRGLEELRRTRRPGLRALIASAGLDLPYVDEGDIGYQLGPRLNAAGRLADAELSVRLLLSQDARAAAALAEQLEALNRDRQGRTEAVSALADDYMARDPELARKPAIILAGDRWDLGVLGLVAGDLARRYNRPAILIAHRPGELSSGSARSVAGVDIHAAIAAQRHLLDREGGHPMAAGFGIDPANVSVFTEAVWRYLAQAAPPREQVAPLVADAYVPWREVTMELAEDLGRLAPFGAGNPKPVLITDGGTLVRAEDVSRTRVTAHRRLHLDGGAAQSLRFTWFNAGELPQLGEQIEVAFHLEVGHWRGPRLELELVDWREALPAVYAATSELVAGREVYDWRAIEDAPQRLARLRERYGDRLLLWAETTLVDAATSQPTGALTRTALAGRQADALAIATAPAGPEALNWALGEVQPKAIYILPPIPLQEPTADEFVAQVAGMVKVALRARGGQIETLRMAARIGACEATVLAALRGLEARGVIALRHADGGLWACAPAEQPARKAPPPAVSSAPSQDIVRHADGAGAVATSNGTVNGAPNGATNGTPNGAATPEAIAQDRARAEEQARQALAYLLRETRAYRQAFARDPLPALLGPGPS